MDPYDGIEHTAVWPDQCKLWNTESSPNKDKIWMFSAYHYEEVCMDVKITGGYPLFIDFNENDVIDGCVELLCNFYKGDQRLTTYQILDNELTNANDDEWFSTMDPLFSKAKAWRSSENAFGNEEFMVDSSRNMKKCEILKQNSRIIKNNKNIIFNFCKYKLLIKK